MKLKLMTKLALAAAVACAALGARAGTTYNYNFYIGALPSGIESTSDYSVYFFATSDSSGFFSDYLTTKDAVIAEVNKGANGSFKNLNSSSSGYYRMGNNKNTGSSYYSEGGATERNASVAASAATFIALILDSSSLSTANNYMIATTSKGVQELTPTYRDDSTTHGYYSYTWDWGSQKNTAWTKVGTVPEPTSGVLLLVGVAALALKRKNAA